MTDDCSAAWSCEIRDYLLGRLGRPHHSLPLGRSYVQELHHVPIRRWWTFEGRRFASIDGTIAAHWPELLRGVMLLDQTFNPRVRLTERPEGEVDWGATLARGPSSPVPEYVVRSSGIGLNDAEHAALRGWLAWIAAEWQSYSKRFGLSAPIPANEVLDGLATPDSPARTFEQIRRWAHVARRSRWPVLRELVAETLRIAVEPDALDRIPLPVDRARLFELLCLVRIAVRVAAQPEQIRWLDDELSANTLELAGVTCWYQQGLGRPAVLASPDYQHGLAEAAEMFDLGVPTQVDLAFEFDEPRNGIAGILVEAKSGGQTFENAVPQLRTYRSARPRRSGARFLVWGVIERSPTGAPSAEQLEWLRRTTREGTGDVWAFSDVDSVDVVIEAAGVQNPR